MHVPNIYLKQHNTKVMFLPKRNVRTYNVRNSDNCIHLNKYQGRLAYGMRESVYADYFNLNLKCTVTGSCHFRNT